MENNTNSNLPRIFGVVTSLILLLTILVYAFKSNIYMQDSTIANTLWLFNYIMVAIFAVLGYGLLLTYFKYSTFSAFLFVLLLVSITTIICPLLLKFWFNAMINGFGNDTITSDLSPFFEFYNHQQKINITPSYYLLRLSLFSALSQLFAFTTILGRIGLLETVLTSIIFNFGWSLALCLNVKIQRNSPQLTLFDDYFISNTYLFAAIYASVMTLFIRKPQANNPKMNTSRESIVLTLLGTFFIFIAFGSTSGLFPMKQLGNAFGYNVGVMNILFAMCACVCSAIGMSLILFDGLILKVVAYATLNGGVLIGTIANTSQNMSIPIALGMFSGIISTLYYRFLYPRINRDRIYDSIGMLGGYFVNAFLGTVLIAPIVISALISISNSPDNRSPFMFNKDASGQVLKYFLLSLIFGAIFGFISGLIIHWFNRNSNYYFVDGEIFSHDFGLFQKQTEKTVKSISHRPQIESAAQIILSVRINPTQHIKELDENVSQQQ